MTKKILIALSTIWLLAGCVNSSTPAVPSVESHTFAGVTLRATPQVSQLVSDIKVLQQNNTMALSLNSNQNVRIGQALNIRVRPNKSGYLKVVIINPRGEQSLVMPNFKHKGHLKANRSFSTTNQYFSLRADQPKGLHYVVVAFSQNDSRLSASPNLLSELSAISNESYGQHYISVFPMRVY